MRASNNLRWGSFFSSTFPSQSNAPSSRLPVQMPHSATSATSISRLEAAQVTKGCHRVDLCGSVWICVVVMAKAMMIMACAPKTNPGVYRPTLPPLGRISRKPMVREWLGSARMTYNVIQRHRFLTRGGCCWCHLKGSLLWCVASSKLSQLRAYYCRLWLLEHQDRERREL